jgi:anti-sigma factor RsiW
MTMMQCETVRDLLPDHARAALAPAERQAVDAHIAACAGCAAEAALVALLARHPVVAPARLEARVLAAVRAPRPARTVWQPGRLALAASLVGALLTGGLLLRQGVSGPTPAVQTSLAEDAVRAGALTWLAEPALSGGPALHDLSIDELETLLQELES